MSKNPIEMLDDISTVKTPISNVRLIESDLKIRQIKNAVVAYEEKALISRELIDFIKMILEV